jgi:hypothetical protein
MRDEIGETYDQEARIDIPQSTMKPVTDTFRETLRVGDCLESCQ